MSLIFSRPPHDSWNWNCERLGMCDDVVILPSPLFSFGVGRLRSQAVLPRCLRRTARGQHSFQTHRLIHSTGHLFELSQQKSAIVDFYAPSKRLSNRRLCNLTQRDLSFDREQKVVKNLQWQHYPPNPDRSALREITILSSASSLTSNTIY